MSQIPWSDHRVAVLTKHYESGYSYAKIAMLMGGGLTREAIGGKINRLGLTRTPRPKVDGTPRKPRLKRDQTLTRLVWDGVPRPAPVVNPSVQGPSCDPVPRHLNLLDLGMNDCRWPYGEGSAITFCANPKEGRRSYCWTHNRIMFARTPAR